jgi:hypothetical protein
VTQLSLELHILDLKILDFFLLVIDTFGHPLDNFPENLIRLSLFVSEHVQLMLDGFLTLGVVNFNLPDLMDEIMNFLFLNSNFPGTLGLMLVMFVEELIQ